jgi:type IV pilus assembly protein PilA
MLHKLRQRAQSEKGFTLIELLVVILIIGILAAIALPAFLGQKTKAQDSAAKSDVRNAVSQIESYYVDNDTYNGSPVFSPKEFDLDNVVLSGASKDGYTLTATSDSGNKFLITKATSGVTRSCTISNADKPGGCTASWGTVTGP